MTPARRSLQLATATSTGLLSGGMLVIARVLVPFWRGMAPRDFRAWFATHSPRIRAVMGPLGAASVATAVATTALEARAGGVPARAAAAAVANAGVVGITLRVNEPANAEFVRPDLDDDRTRALLGTWVRWHGVRVALGIAGTVAAASTAMGRRG